MKPIGQELEDIRPRKGSNVLPLKSSPHTFNRCGVGNSSETPFPWVSPTANTLEPVRGPGNVSTGLKGNQFRRFGGSQALYAMLDGILRLPESTLSGAGNGPDGPLPCSPQRKALHMLGRFTTK